MGDFGGGAGGEIDLGDISCDFRIGAAEATMSKIIKLKYA